MDYSDRICTLFIQYLDGNLPHFHLCLLWSLLLSLWQLQLLESTEMQKRKKICTLIKKLHIISSKGYAVDI